MAEWSFLTNHARVLVCIAHDPGVRLRDIATTLGITERSAYSIVTDLTDGGYVVKDKDGRRNRYQIQPHLPLREAITQERTIGEVLDVLVESKIPKRDDERPGDTRARKARVSNRSSSSSRFLEIDYLFCPKQAYDGWRSAEGHGPRPNAATTVHSKKEAPCLTRDQKAAMENVRSPATTADGASRCLR